MYEHIHKTLFSSFVVVVVLAIKICSFVTDINSLRPTIILRMGFGDKIIWRMFDTLWVEYKNTVIIIIIILNVYQYGMTVI